MRLEQLGLDIKKETKYIWLKLCYNKSREFFETECPKVPEKWIIGFKFVHLEITPRNLNRCVYEQKLSSCGNRG
jgi:hypothetical protein